MIRCPQCNRTNEDNYRFCYVCGTPLPQPEPRDTVDLPQPEQEEAPDVESPIVEVNLPPQQPKAEDEERLCHKCGTAIPPDFLFCGKCGSRFQPTPGKKDAPEPVKAEEPVVSQLVLIRPDGSTGETYDLHAGENIIGRLHGLPLFKNDPFLSPRHASFVCESGSAVLNDLSSLNGVFVRVTQEISLQHRDRIRIGQELLLFEYLDKIESEVSPKTSDQTPIFGGDRGDAWGRLTRVSSAILSSHTYLLSGVEATIGRETGDITFPFDGFVSGRHARIAFRDQIAWLKDLGSSNGTYLRIIEPTKLVDNQLILLGQQLFRIQIT